MASRGRKETGTMRKISKPVISTDVMGNRNVEVRAVGAWVQSEQPSYESQAVIAAEQEQNRLHILQLEKQARLKQFQNEVKKRVNKLDKLKKQKMLETNYKALEHERHIVGQSAFASEDSGKKDTSLIRPNSALALLKSKSYQGEQKASVDEDDVLAFTDQTNQVHQNVKNAKKSLMGRQVITDNYKGDNLPGGVWKVSKTRDRENKDHHPTSRYTVEGDEFDILDDELIEKVKIVNNKAHDVADDNVDDDADDDDAEADDKENHGILLAPAPERTVNFNLMSQSDDVVSRPSSYKHTVSTFSGTDVHRYMPLLRVPNIYEGVQTEEEKRRARSQQAMYRRLFMDLEREQVKENLRRQEHRKRILKIKKDKEEERVKEEKVSRQMIEPRDPVTGETSQQAIQREQQERQFIRQTMKEHERRIQKSKEMERYIEALRQQLKEKVRRKKIELPPLCCCGDSIWDTNPETCANNCFFYKNPKEYGRALQSMLDSSELAVS